ncbi:MAG: hypothetical protein ACREOK_01275 [Gemmatimonadaceae bacterium]
MRIDFRWATLLAILGAAGACARAAARPAAEPPSFRGVYEVGPDRSAFRLCGSEELWYVDASSSPAWTELQRQTRMQNETPSGMRPPASRAVAFQRAYVEVQGDTVALTAGPEVGRYTREFRPTRVLVARPAPRAECP